MLQGTQYCLIRKYVPMRPPSGKVWRFSIQWWVFFYASSIAYKVLNTWPALLFMRYMDLPRIRSTKYSFLGFHQRVEYLFPRSYMSIKIQTKEIMMLRGKKKKTNWKVFPPRQVKICFLSKCVSREDHTWLQLASYILDTGKLFFDAPDPLFRRMHTTSNSIKFLIVFHV